jgi:hypothetical protein
MKIDIENAKKVRNKLHMGDKITDEELNDAIDVYEIIVEFLHCDVHLHLAWKELHYDLIELKSFQEARKH